MDLSAAAITLWNTVYLERAAEEPGKISDCPSNLFQHVSPPGWENVD
jgi:hypothetical protein